ncbi:RimJ/RimL family protein N-acetyltransferase [Kribbella antiqua]|uniref:RimJ/RimL family protein N-acetyltransferase n=1 Tax=Kribbella antiqua TaxID=2512217 RepID=A0A4R2IKA0_9ACTN|nr:GNAT family N-acetyltransferase [Kribbella antiqua]TCO45404.1 RimJ/RimL family protein N-acetyltransferase [Kribbella antiqua]
MPIPPEHPVLTDGVVTLRAPRPDDVPGQLERHREDPDRRFDADDARRWITYGIHEAWKIGTRLVFVIEYQGQYAGTVGLEPDPHGNASIHYGLASRARGAGVASRAVRLALDFGFGECGFHVVHWWARVGNWPSRRVAWATGFRMGEAIPGFGEEHGRRVDAWTGWIGPDDERKPRRPWFDHPVLETPRLRLRTWRDDEISRITTARTNQATAHFLPFIPQPFTAEDARFWLKDMAEQAAAGHRYNWCLADAETDLGLGNLTLFNLGYGEAGELGYWVHPDAQGRGLMTEAIRRVADWFFSPDGYGGHRLLIRTAATNQAARRVAESAGFQHAGTEREAFPLATHLDARVTYDLLPTDLTP